MSLLTRHTKPFSSDTPREKEQMQETVEGYRQQMDAQWQELKGDATHYGKQALIIGGVVAGVYLLMDALLPAEDSTEEEPQASAPVPPEVSRPKSTDEGLSVGKALRGLAWTFAVGWARKQLTHFVEAEKKTDA
jgi:hypothetical protein